MARRKKINTRLEIIQIACRRYIDEGFVAITNQMIAKEAGISVGNLNYHFPTKEDLLAVLVDELCSFQWKLLEEEVDDGYSELMCSILELTTIASACEQDPVAREFFLAAYQHSIPLQTIRENDTIKNKKIYSEFNPTWTDKDFALAEIVVSGIEYGVILNTDLETPFDERLTFALDSIMKLFNVPEEIRKVKIEKVLKMDYLTLGSTILQKFKDYVAKVNASALKEAEIIKKRKNKKK